ncbi:OLC1v1016050C1 [Oldenlandia corymbosa var. corymbosa]|uniref:OLC1v1016050C1 n=1 Tax=Oldenlandia corymbosa var. corymbosa TaxID=529605 RepID=A0AAV1E774_OLDCO|nr:OLC1v1016050C1 [Oldenlandia corymbosa var. corymbosa]
MARNVSYMLNLYHTSKYVIENGSINTFSNMPDDGLFVEERLSYEGLISKICMTLGWDPAHVKLHLSLIFDSPGSSRAVKIKNDSHVEFMNRVDPMSCLDLYIDLEDITQEEREASLENVSFGGFPRGERASTSRNRDEEETPLFAQNDYREESDSDYIAPSESEEDCDVSGESDFEESDDERLENEERDCNLLARRHIYSKMGNWDASCIDKDEFALKMWDETPEGMDIGVCFKSQSEAKHAVKLWNIHHKREYTIAASSPRTWAVRCRTFNVKSEEVNHHVSGRCVLIRRKVEDNVDYTVVSAQKDVKNLLKVDVPYKRAWHRRRKAIEAVYGDWTSNFEELPRNLVSRYNSKKVKRLCWKMGTTLSRVKYNHMRAELIEFKPAAWEYLRGIGGSNWARSKAGLRRWGIATTNISESYNNALKGIRFLPIRALIDATFRKTVKFYREEQLSARNCMTPIPPELWKKYEKMNDKEASFEATPFDGDDAMWRVVTATRLSGMDGSLHTVNYDEHRCSCRKWQEYRMPCTHVLQVCRRKGDRPIDLYHSVWRLPTWRRQFEYTGFVLVPDEEQWPMVNWNIIPNYELLVLHAGPRRSKKGDIECKWITGIPEPGEMLEMWTTRIEMATPASGSQYDYQPKHLHPGPIQDKMLYRQTKYRSQAVYENKIPDIKIFRLKDRRYDSDFWALYKNTAPKVWAYERIERIAPQRKGVDYLIDETAPLAQRWECRYTYGDAPRSSTPPFRDQLTSLRVEDVLHRLPDFCTQGQAIWTTRCWMFCWAIRELHESGRVVRQFGYIQDVPKRPMIKDNAAFLLDHAHSMSGYPSNNWVDHLSAVRRHWNRREEFVLRDLEERDPGSVYEGYYEWFMVNTVRLISNPDNYEPRGYETSSCRVKLYGEVLNNIRVSTERFREKREDDNLLDEELDKHLDDIINQTHAALTLGANDEMEVEDTQILVDEDTSLPSQPPPGKKAKPWSRDNIGGGRKRKVTIPPRTSQQQTEGQRNEDQAHSSRGSRIQVETHFEEAGGPETQFDLGGPKTQFGGQSQPQPGVKFLTMGESQSQPQIEAQFGGQSQPQQSSILTYLKKGDMIHQGPNKYTLDAHNKGKGKK